MATSILLEAGTNEMELLAFKVGETNYGINVAKVKELIGRQRTTPIPCAPDCVEGSFMLRDMVLQLVDLAKYLGVEPAAACKHDKLIIVVEFNHICCGVLVDAVDAIHRLSWDQVEPPSAYISSLGVPVTAVTKIQNEVVLILDFETIIGSVFPNAGTQARESDEVPEMLEYSKLRVLTVDDSPTIRMSLGRVLEKAGFEDVTLCSDGEEAWALIRRRYEETGEAPFDLVLTDIEMPRMDGLHLTRNIKDTPELKDMPVILFSSLIREDNTNKGVSVGADAQITKFDTEELLRVVNDCLSTCAA